MFGLLLRVRTLSLWNAARDAASRHRLFSAGLVVLGTLLFAAVYAGFRLFLSLVHTGDEMRELVFEIFYFLFLFLLAGAVPFVASTLLHSSDYLLLSAAPLRPRAIVAAKLVDATVTNSLQFAVIGLPAIVACGAALRLPPAGWAALPVLVAFFVLLPALATALLLLAALATVGIRRVRSAITTVNALMATIVCLTIVMQAGHLQFQRTLRQGIAPIVLGAPPSSRINPSAPFAWSLIELADGRIGEGLLGIAGITLGIALLYAACTLWGGKLLSGMAAADDGENDSPMAVETGEVRAHRSGLLAIFTSPVAALIAKDLRYVLRDSVLLSQLGMPVILFFVPFVLAMQQDTFRSLNSPAELYPFAAAMTGIIVFMQTSILSLSSIGLESRSFWLVLSSPNGGRTLLAAKFVMSTLVSSAVGLFLTAVSAIVFRAAPGTALVEAVMVVLCSAALCGLGVGISAALPRFVYENPAHRVSAWAMILGFLATVGYLVVAAVITATAWELAGLVGQHAGIVYLTGAGLFVFLTLGAILVPLAIGARRIEVYQWEH